MGKYQNQNKIHGNGGALFYPGNKRKVILLAVRRQRINDYEENFFSHTQTEVRVASRQGNSRGTKLTVPFSCSVLPVVAWCWQADSSVSWSDFEGEEREVSSQAKEKSPPSGPSWNSAVWSHEDTRLAPGVRGGTPESESGEEVLRPLGGSDLVTCVWL
jgi:hypothetical protein